MAGGVLYNSYVLNNSILTVSSGGIIVNCNNGFGGVIHISSGGVAVGTSADDYLGLVVSSGGIAYDTVVHTTDTPPPLAALDVATAAYAKRNLIYSNGLLKVIDGGIAEDNIGERYMKQPWPPWHLARYIPVAMLPAP